MRGTSLNRPLCYEHESPSLNIHCVGLKVPCVGLNVGFTGSQAVRALRLSRGHLEAAAELLVSGNV